MNLGIYILDGHTPLRVDALVEWAQWMQSNDRVVDAIEITVDGKPVFISTVFLGIDHRHFGKGPPIVFETMIFGGSHDQYQERCCTWDEALAMHARACNLVTETARHIIQS